MSARVVCVGDQGRALTAMSPSGLVELDGRRVDARSERELIPAGAAVVVLRGDPTGYVVRRVGPDHPVPDLPDAGAEIARPEFMRNSAEARAAEARDEAERDRWWRQAARRRVWLATAYGGVGGLVCGVRLEPFTPSLYGGLGEPILGVVLGLFLTLPIGHAGRRYRWSAFAANAAVGAGFVGAAVMYTVMLRTDHPAWVVAGALAGGRAGLMAGWFAATRLDMVFGGPDAGE